MEHVLDVLHFAKSLGIPPILDVRDCTTIFYRAYGFTLHASLLFFCVHVDNKHVFCQFVRMNASKQHSPEAMARRATVLSAARWCFLNFGFAKTSLEDIAKRAKLSRTLLYRSFKGKEDIFKAVFADWLLARHPAARQAASALGEPYDRLLNVCRVMVLEPWIDMVGTPMGADFIDACGQIDPEADAEHRRVAHQCVMTILGDEENSAVFILALDGLLADAPTPQKLEHRIRILAAHFAQPLKAHVELKR